MTSHITDQQLDRSTLLALYRQLFTIRRFEERTAELFKAGKVYGSAHSCIGQEAVAVGAASVLREDDYVVGHHRSHGHVIAKGGDVYSMFAELMGKASGYCRGMGGSMHIADLELGILGCNGIVGAGLPIGCGAALGTAIRGGDQVTVCFFGDGAINQGLAHEAFNMATTWRLPVVFVCENNHFQLSAEWQETRALESIAVRAGGYGMPSDQIDGNDVFAVRAAVAEAVARARENDGPTLIEAKTYRRMQHSMRANLPDLRDQEVARLWEEQDPLRRFSAALAESGVGDEETDAVESEVEQLLDEAVAQAEADEELTPEGAQALVYVSREPTPSPEPRPAGRQINFSGALQEALEQEMEADERVIVLGEDVAELGGIFRSTVGLWERFGGERVRNTPISEGGFVGAAVGAALTGMRPVVEIQIFDFVTLAMDPIVNQAAKLRFMTGGKAEVPIVVRGPSGAGVRLAAQHSQSLEAWFAHVPGLIVVAPSGPADAKGLLTAAIRDDNPVIFLETKSLLFGEEEVDEDPYSIPLGKAAIKHPGDDVTLVATQALVPAALRAARTLAKEGVGVEVIDPRTLYPLDLETIMSSLARTNRLVIAHEAVSFCGIGAEISAAIAEHGFWELDAPIVRVGAPHRPMPYSKNLESATIPDADDLIEAIRRLPA